LVASGKLLRNGEFHIDYLGHAQHERDDRLPENRREQLSRLMSGFLLWRHWVRFLRTLSLAVLLMLLLPLEVFLAHVSDDLRDFRSGIKGSRGKQGIKYLGEIVDEAMLGGAIHNRKHPNRLQSSLLGFLNALLVIDDQDVRLDFASESYRGFFAGGPLPVS
jgi:hypothetical protein